MNKMYKILTVVLLAAWLFTLWKAPRFFSPEEAVFTVKDKGANSALVSVSNFVDGKEEDNRALYSSIIERLKLPYQISRYQPLIARNIFSRPEKAMSVFNPESLILVSVNAVNLPFVYTGFIQTANGGIIGQINWMDKTYFVKKNDNFKDYKVLDIDKNMIRIEGKEGALSLEFKKPSKGKELIAVLYNTVTQKKYEARKGDELDGYKILDISKDNVILYGQNKQWVISEER
ncbi:MAG: hypothetical protein V1933_04425 [Candidatus Omnitrophota bacterium]